MEERLGGFVEAGKESPGKSAAGKNQWKATGQRSQTNTRITERQARGQPKYLRGSLPTYTLVALDW